MMGAISVANATLNNLKEVSVDLPWGEFICLAGPSGSGKSSFAMGVVLRACVDPSFGRSGRTNLVSGTLPAIAVRQRLKIDRRIMSVARFLGLSDFLVQGLPGASPCPHCGGRGVQTRLIPDKAVTHPDRPLATTALHPMVRAILGSAAKRIPMQNTQRAFEKLPRAEQARLLFGQSEQCGRSGWRGLEFELLARVREQQLPNAEEDLIEAFFAQRSCEACGGLGVRGPNGLTTEGCRLFARSFALGELIEESLSSGRVKLSEPLGNSSLCEFQRVRIVSALQLVQPGSLVLLDEPCAGMARDDALWVIDICRSLRAAKCTVVVVEHSPLVVLSADRVVEFGPGAGPEGGQIVFNGLQAAFRIGGSRTMKALRSIAEQTPESRSSRVALGVSGSSDYGLGRVELRVPEFRWTCIAGESGTGKSGAIDLFFRAMDKSAGAWLGRIGVGPIEGRDRVRRPQLVDQEPIGLNARSIPLTYIDAMTALRDRFAEIAHQGGLRLGHGDFSFNKDEGWCSSCEGSGVQEIEVEGEAFIAPCRTCGGMRYRPEVLKVLHRGLSIGQILQLSVREVLQLIPDEPTLSRKLSFMGEVGLGYLVVGQPSNTLSGGEAQRVKMATQLSKRLGDRTLYLLDTPSRGLAATDVGALANVFRRLAARNTVVVADNHLGFVSVCDWLIVLGKANGGSRQLFAGPPHEAPTKVMDLICARGTISTMLKTAGGCQKG